MNALESKVKEVHICMLMDIDHAEDKVSFRSRIDFLIYVNTTPVQWFSNKQSTVETSTYMLWVFQYQVPQIFMGTTCQFSLIHPNKNQYSERKATPFAIM